MHPVSYVSTDSRKLGWKGLEGSEITALGPPLLLTNRTLEIFGQLEGSCISSTSLQSLYHVFWMAVTCSTVKKIKLLLDGFIGISGLLFDSNLSSRVGLMGSLGHRETEILQLAQFLRTHVRMTPTHENRYHPSVSLPSTSPMPSLRREQHRIQPNVVLTSLNNLSPTVRPN